MVKEEMYSTTVNYSKKQRDHYLELKKAFGYTMAEIITLGIKRAYKAIEYKNQYAAQHNATVAFIVNLKEPRVERFPPERGHRKVIFIKSIEKLKINRLRVHYQNYEFKIENIKYSHKDFHIKRVCPTLVKQFL